MKQCSYSTVIGAIALVLLSTSCSQSAWEQSAVAIEPRDHTFQVRAYGEIVPSESININMPRTVNMQFQIMWLVPEYSEVKKGDVIARFDDSDVLQMQSGQLVQVAFQDLGLESYARMSEIMRTEIEHESERVDGETDIAEAFVGVDPTYFSRNEMIDAVDNLDYLAVQEAFYMWQADTHDRRTQAETMRLAAQKESIELQLEKNQAAMNVMELRSPEDGTFVYAKTPWGEKLTRGHPIFPGRPVGLLPIKGKILARIWVPEVDAVGIETNQRVVLRLDSYVEEEYSGTITNVSSVATTIDRDDPTKFIVVEASFDHVDPEFMRVGSTLAATIITGELKNALLVPQQAVFFDQGEPYLYVLERSEPRPRQVVIGHRSPTLIEIIGGLEHGEQVSLVAPTSPTA